MSPQYLSSLALDASVVVYTLAMCSHAAEWASARGVSTPETAPERRQLAGVGARGETVFDAVDDANAAVTGSTGSATGGETAASRVRVEMFGRMGVALTVIGFLLSVAGVLFRGVAAVPVLRLEGEAQRRVAHVVDLLAGAVERGL